MLSSRRTKISNSDVVGGQSIFDFLKRKKRVSLQNSLSQSRKDPADISSLSILQIKQYQGQSTTLVQTARNRTTHRKNASQKITPKKVTFADSQQKKNTARTFIDMISPLKSKQLKTYDLQLCEEQQVKNNRSSLSTSKPIIKNKSTQKQFTRRQLNSSINVMKQTLLKLIKVGKSIKQKSHLLFLDMKPIFKIVQQSQNKLIKKKLQQTKQRLRTMQFQFGQLDVQNADEIIQSFHKTLSDHLISLQAKNKATFEKSQLENITRVRAQKDAKISQLQDINKRLQSNVNVLQRKIQKLTKNIQLSKQEQEKKYESLHGNSQLKIESLQDNIRELEQSKLQLFERIKTLQKQTKQKDKKLRDLSHTAETMQRKFLQKCDMQKSARQQFLVNQIMMLKQQFQKDMKQLTHLYSTKQQDQNILIQQQKRQILQLKQYCQLNKQNQKRNSTDSQNMKLVLNKYKKQNQCLVSDLHRMNQELYQHWLALKDIKILANRLHILPKFSRIYQDLAFNDMLFS